MRVRLSVKVLGAVAAAILIVGVAAAPAPAGTVMYASITIDGTTFEFGGNFHPDDSFCAHAPDSFDSTVSGVPGTFSVSDLSMSTYFRPSGSDRWRITLDFDSYGGEVTPGSVNALGDISGSDLVLSFTMEDYEDGTAAGRCHSLGVGVCDGVVGLESRGTYATNGAYADTISLEGGSAFSTAGPMFMFATGCGAAVGRYDWESVVLDYLLAVTP